MNTSESKIIINNNENNKSTDVISSPKNIKEDILYFKEDILKDIKHFENRFNVKYQDQTTVLKSKLDKYDLKMEAMTQKITSLGNKISTNISLKEKVEELYDFKNKIQNNVITQDIRLDSIIKDLKNAINKFDDILLESVIYSGLIGVNAKFKNFHELIDFILLNLNQLNSFKEKNSMDLKSYKKKIETISQNLKIQVDSINKNNMEYNNRAQKEVEKKINSFFEEYNSKIMQIRMENNQYGKLLEEKANLLNENYKNVEKMKYDMEEKVKYEINKIGDISEKFCLRFDNYQKEFNNIKKRFIALSEFIKNNKFQNNEAKNLSNKLKFNKKSNDLLDKENQELFSQKIEEEIESEIKKKKNLSNSGVSLLKQYIHGEVNLRELCEDRKKILRKRYSEKSNISIIATNNLNICKEIELIINQGSSEYQEKVHHLSFEKGKTSYNIEYSKLKANNFKSNYACYSNKETEDKKEKENNNSMILTRKIINKDSQKYKKITKRESDNEKIIINSNNKTEGNEKNESLKNEEVNNKKEINFNDNKDYNEQFFGNNKYQYNYGFDGNNNDFIKRYSSETALVKSNNNNSIISIINYGNRKKMNLKENKELKKFPILENKKEIIKEEIINNDNKKLLETRNNIINSNKKNNNSIKLSNTVSIKKKMLENNLYLLKTNKNTKKKIITDIKRNVNNSNSFIVYEKINMNPNKNILEIDSKKMIPIRLKEHKNSSDLIEKRINEIELCYDEDKKIEKLMEKLKEMIPYEENSALSDRINISKINKNIFAKKNNFSEKSKKEINKNNFSEEKILKNEYLISKLNSISNTKQKK